MSFFLAWLAVDIDVSVLVVMLFFSFLVIGGQAASAIGILPRCCRLFSDGEKSHKTRVTFGGGCSSSLFTA